MTYSQGEVLIALFGYFIVIATIGVSAAQRTKNVSDFTLGGRSLAWPTVALSTHASGFSGWLLLGLPGMMYVSGLSAFWIMPGLFIGALCSWIFISKRLRTYSVGYDQDAITLPQFFIVRTGSKSLAIRLIPPIVVLLFYTVYLASGFIAGAKLIEAVLGWPYLYALVLGMVLIMVYVTLGGFLASSWTDTFQASMIIIALLVVGALAGNQPSVNIEISIDARWDASSISSILSLLAWGLGYLGQPHLLARFMAIKNVKDLPKAGILGLSWMLVCLVTAACIGLFGAELIPNLEDPEKIYIHLAEMLLNPWIAGVVIAAILAAIMSTVDSQLVVASAAVTQDLGIGKSKGLFMNRITVILLCTFAGLIAIDPQSVLDVVALAWAGLGASFGPALLFCLFWSQTSEWGVIIGILVGTFVVLVWELLLPGPLGVIYEMLPAFILSSLSVFLFSKWIPSEAARRRAFGKHTETI